MSSAMSMGSAMLADVQSLLKDDLKRFPERWPHWLCVVIRKHTRPWSRNEPKDRANYAWLLIERDKNLRYVNKEYFRRMQVECKGENTEMPFALTTLDGSILDPSSSVSQISHEDVLVLCASLTATTIPVKKENDPISSMTKRSGECGKAQPTGNAPAKGTNSNKALDSAETGISVNRPSRVVCLPVRFNQLHQNENITLHCRTSVVDSSMADSLAVGILSKSLEKLASHNNLERLEAGVGAGLEILAEVEKDLCASQNASIWLTQIEEIRKDATRPPTVIGVVGNTGAGKSSVINALLDEAQLVPTNCMRACTAVVTEISYNYSNNMHARYRAEIEFISPEDWRKELEILFGAVFDENGHVSRAAFTDDTEASIAYAKMRAVYNQYTNDMLQNATVDSLLEEEKVSSVLGSTLRLYAKDPIVFYRKLQQYVDSSENDTSRNRLNVLGYRIAQRKRNFGYWPLIKVVKIYTKADALSTGAVVVDLPGVQDSNAARAAVADNYMKKCNSLWIVAPITRAVDDKAAKVLLGKTFKRQLQFDDAYSAVTFICSKTDDISITEATRSLQLGEQMAYLGNRATNLRSSKTEVQQELELVAEDMTTVNASIDKLEEDIERLESLLNKTNGGRLAQSRSGVDYDASSGRTRKRARYNVEQDQVVAEESKAQTALDIAKLKLKTERNRQKELRGKIEDMTHHIKLIDEQAAENQLQRSILCIAGRNEYSRNAIQQDFASGIRELDMAHKEEEDPYNFDPADEIRDYDLLARQLPVFCVSSRAYQQLCGKLQSDASVTGFKQTEHTEIPQLQDHCKQLTARARKTSYCKFLNNLQQLINSVKIWALGENQHQLTAKQHHEENAFMNETLGELAVTLETAVKSVMKEAACTLNSQLITMFRPGAKRAELAAMPTCLAWSAPLDKGGLAWTTYKAVVRHHGVFHSSVAGSQDFNRTLAEPILETLASGWEKAFQHLLPKTVSQFSVLAGSALDAFHKSVEHRCHDQNYAIARVALLRNQRRTYSIMLDDVVSSALQMLSEGQRSCNREFSPAIALSMEPAFAACAKESGKGQFERIKSRMANHVKSETRSMFQTATNQVQMSLKQLFEAIAKMMLRRIHEIIAKMRRDYLNLSGVEENNSACSRFVDSATRKVILGILAASETKFLDVLEGDIDNVTRQYKSVNDLAAEAFEEIEGACLMDEDEEFEACTAEDGMDFED